MGAWSTGLYSDDTACDVRDDYVRLLKIGRSSEEAEQEIMSRFTELMADKQIECLVILPLADTQWKYGRLSSYIKERAIRLLANGGDLEFWERDSPSDVGARKRVLKSLHEKLSTSPPPPKSIKVSIPNDKPKKRRLSAPIGTVFYFPISGSIYLPLILLSYYELEKSIEPIFCVFPTPIELGKPLPSEALTGNPLALASGLGPVSVFGAFPNDERSNPYKQLQEAGTIFGVQLPEVPKSPTFYSFGGVGRRIEKAFYSQNNPE